MVRIQWVMMKSFFNTLHRQTLLVGIMPAIHPQFEKRLDLAARHGVSVGAHPGYPDRLHFGRVANSL